jgi:hypothetical protein
VLDVDASELPEGFLSECVNADPDGEVCRKRLGRAVAYTAPSGAGAVVAIGAKYPTDGGAPTILYARNNLAGGAGNLFKANTLIGALANSNDGYYELLPFRNEVYVGATYGGLQKLNAALTAITAVSILIAPPFPMVIGIDQAPIETFDSGAWTAVNAPQAGGTAVATAYRNTFHREGSNMLEVTAAAATAEGSYAHRTFGAVVDMSSLSALILWVRGNAAGLQYQVGIYRDGATPGTTAVDWDCFPIYSIGVANEWEQVRVPLAGVQTSERQAVPGLAIRYLDDAGTGYGTAPLLFFDDLKGQGQMTPGRYRYFTTFYDSTTDRESAPATPTVIDLAEPFKSVTGAVLGNTAATAANRIRLYRYREEGPLARPRLIQELTHSPLQTTVTAGMPVAAGDAIINVTSSAGWAINDYAQINAEVVKVTNVGAGQLTVTRAQLGTLAGAHAALTDVARVFVWTDTKSDGQMVIDDAAELIQGTRLVPLARCWAVVNHRLLAGNIYDGANYQPYRLMLSTFNKPEEFIQGDQPDDHPNAGGFIDLPGGDRGEIRRIVEWNGMAVVFTDRSIYTLEGTQWPSQRADLPEVVDPFRFRKRADVGLDARGAVAVTNQAVYFLAHDGIRVLLPGQSGSFACFLISEPVNRSRLESIRAGYRHLTVLGVDERGRIHVSYVYGASSTTPDQALIFDPRRKDALSRGENPNRPGWTEYTNWGYTALYRLKHGGGHHGQLLGGHPSNGKVLYLHRDSTNTKLEADEGLAISWGFLGPTAEPYPSRDARAALVFGEFAPQPGQTVTFRVVQDRGAAEHSVSKSLGTDPRRLVPLEARLPADVYGHYLQAGVSGVQSVAMTVHSCGLAVTPR